MHTPFRKIIYFFPLFGLLLFSNCSKKEYNKDFYNSKHTQKKLSLNKVGEFTIQPSNLINIGKLTPYFAISNDTTFLFFDELKKKFFYVDAEGKILNVIGGEGRGPKEFIRVNHFTLDEHNNIVAFDDGQVKIKIISQNDEIINTFEVDLKKGSFPIGHYVYARNNNIYIGVIDTEFINQSWKSELISIYNYNGNLIALFGKYDPYLIDSKVQWNVPFFDIDFEQEKIISVNQSSYRLQILNLNNAERLAYFGKKPESFKMSQEATTISMPLEKKKELSNQMSFSEGAYFTDKYYLHFFMNLTEAWHQTLDLSKRKYFLSIYDKESQDLYNTLRLPYSLGAVKNNKLYLIENDNPEQYTIGLYEIK